MATRILMRVMRSLSLKSFVAGLLVAGLLHSVPARAQIPTPTPEQLQMLQNLTPEQRDEILKQITGGGSSSSGSTLGSSSSATNRDRAADQGETADLDARRRSQSNEQELDENGEPIPRIPVMKGDDWVVIKIDLPQAQPGQAAGAGGVPSPGGTAVPAPPGGMVPQANSPLSTVPGTVAPQLAPMSRAMELSKEEKEKREKLRDLIRSRNPYRLTSEGVLQLPGFPGIQLAGLTEFQATVRLQADPNLRDFDVSLIRLPLKKIGAEALKPFGYDLFDRAPSTFAPVTNVPCPADYVVGPGDQLEVQLYGNQNRTLRLTVGRDGRVSFPELGPINVGGQRFTAVKESIEARVERQMIGVRASVSMGDTRSIRIYVFGDAKRPGSYTISGLGTITSALYAAGGVKRIGSLRDVQLKRQGQVVRHFDLYD